MTCDDDDMVGSYVCYDVPRRRYTCLAVGREVSGDGRTVSTYWCGLPDGHDGDHVPNGATYVHLGEKGRAG